MAGLVEAASELESIARHLRRAGEGELVRELTRAMRDAVGTVPDDIRAGLRPKLPDRYAATLDADLRLGVNVRTNERDPGVSVTGQARSKARKLRNLDEGRLTHPVFGNREEWRTQEEPSVQPGWFTGPAQAGGPRVRTAIERALADVADKAVKGA
ncbi:MAG TPA: hypothetical protein VNH17_16655 [Streptosporangiaceae bacterium]|nr:hypothetical protein [Streptosporangiaceae bacterium]